MNLTASDENFLRELEQATLPAKAFSHEAHLRAAYLYLCQLPWAEATARMVKSIQGFAAANNAAGLYHETITVAYMSLVQQRRLAAQPHLCDWPTFLANHPDLLRKDLLLDFYTKAELDSPEAKRGFLLPGFAAK